ncbi:14266_t:CDS:1, partial [Funneliformis caledonium]
MSDYSFIYDVFFISEELLLPLTNEAAVELLKNIDEGNQNVNLFYYVQPFTPKICNVTFAFQCVQKLREFHKIESQFLSFNQTFTFKNDQAFDSRN